MPPRRRASRSPSRRRGAASAQLVDEAAGVLSDADDSAGDSSSSYEAAVLKIVEEALGGESPQGRRRSPSTRASMRRQASPFLSDVRRRLRAEREALSVLLRQRTSPVRGRARAAANVAKKGVDQAKRRVGQVARRVRKQITGAEDRRLRDMLRQRLDEVRAPRQRVRWKLAVLAAHGVCSTRHWRRTSALVHASRQRAMWLAHAPTARVPAARPVAPFVSAHATRRA